MSSDLFKIFPTYYLFTNHILKDVIFAILKKKSKKKSLHLQTTPDPGL